MEKVDILIVGAGPAGLSAAIKAKELGVKNLLLIERNKHAGGILNQCIHNGFGIHFFKEELTGPEYANRLLEKAKELNVNIFFESMVLDISENKIVKVLTQDGVKIFEAKAIILATGCRERPRGAINIPGDRCSGIFTAGTTQELINIKGYNIGKEAVILGSGDIGLIMARRLTFESVKVKCVLEIMPYSSGLKRNIAQCIDDFDIPLYFNHTITEIVGKDRVEYIKIAEVDENFVPIKETEQIITCDTVLFSVGLIPENELISNIDVKMSNITGGAIVDDNYETSISGIFACGNTLHVHDLVDNVTYEAFATAESAVDFIENKKDKNLIKIEIGNGIRYAIPNFIDKNKISEKIEIKFRTDNVYRNSKIKIFADEKIVFEKKYKIMTPGEMEVVSIEKNKLFSGDKLNKVLIIIEVK